MKLRLKDGRKSVGLCLRYLRYSLQRRSSYPRIKYMPPEEFIRIHNKVNKYVHYCEVLIDSRGYVAYARPSHQEAVFGGDIYKKAMYEYKTEIWDYCMEKLCDDFRVVMVWYESIMAGNIPPTPQQISTIYQLYLAGCIGLEAWSSLGALMMIRRYDGYSKNQG